MNKLSMAAVCLEMCLLLVGVPPAARAQGGTIINVPAGGNLQSAIDAAVPGDTIQLQPGAIYTGSFVLTAKSGAGWITIRTAPAIGQPDQGVRVRPAQAPLLARLASGSTQPAVRTSGAAHHYRLMLLEFGPNSQGSGEIVQLGQADSTQTSLAQVPHSLILDRLYIHGDPLNGQKRGIALNSASTDIVNCYLADLKGIGQDTQAIAAMNGPGPYLIQNNYLEAAGENFLAGGVDPQIAGLTPSDITFRYNHLFKPPSWRAPIVAAPAQVAAVAAGAGALPAGTYGYRVVAERPAGPVAIARSPASAEVSVTLTESRAVTVSWAPVEHATGYRVYGRVAGASQYWSTSSTTFVDDGGAGTAGTPGAGTVWTVKNLFELKNARRVIVERNVMENNWQGGQPGYAIVLTPRNSGGACTWCAVETVVFRFNIVRHTAAGVNILGYDNTAPSGQARDITLRHNLFYEVNKTAWGGNGMFVQVGDGPADLVIDHNTIDHNGTSLIYAYGSRVSTGVQITSNLARNGSYGIFGAGTAAGTPTIDTYFPGALVISNVLAGGSASKYPAGNLFPTVADHLAQFVAPSAGDYALVGGSSYVNAAPEGNDLGANIAEVAAAAALAIGGTPAGSPTPVRITTTNVPRGTIGTALATTFQATGGSGQYRWSIGGALPVGVSFDASTATLSGIPAEFGRWTLTVRVVDATSATNEATQSFELSVWPSPVTIDNAALPAETVGRPASGVLSAVGGTGSYRWRVVAGALPSGVVLDEGTGVVAGTPLLPGQYGFTVEAADVAYPELMDRETASVTVAPAPVVITTGALPGAVQGQSYAGTLEATGGASPLTWAITSGTLPPGLSFGETGRVTGVPTTVGSWTIVVKATDSMYPSNAASATLTIVVVASKLTIVTTTLPEARRTYSYSVTLIGAGSIGTLSWRIAAGSLPPGLTLGATGVLSGKPGHSGYWTFTVEVADSATPRQVATRQLTLTVLTKNGWKP